MSDHEALGVELDAHVVQPRRTRVCADHQEEIGCVEPHVLERHGGTVAAGAAIDVEPGPAMTA
jgi:hypothetical protein